MMPNMVSCDLKKRVGQKRHILFLIKLMCKIRNFMR
jgi:hypothetical protein